MAEKISTETGTFAGGLSYFRIGSGPENLVILPGITLENEPPGRLAAWTYRVGFGRFAEGHTVYVLNRRRGMTLGYSMADMAADVAGAMERIGPARLMGFSTGGSIAQHVALNRPELVTKLLLVVSACRLSAEGRRICERWRTLALEHRWPDLHAEMAAVTVTGETSKRIAGTMMRVFGRFVLGAPADPLDFVTTLGADLEHDTTDRLGGITVPTLVVGGGEDPFFPEPLLRETAQAIPDATLRVFEGVGHGVTKERKRQYEDEALRFLDAPVRSAPRERKEA